MIERGDGSERYNTLYAYQSCGNYLKTTHPDGATEIRTYFKDGKPKAITGTAVPRPQIHLCHSDQRRSRRVFVQQGNL